MKLINKDALVAEIKRQLSAIDDCPKLTDTQIAVLEGDKVVLTKLLSFLDTLEVKEVDLEKEIDNYLYSNLGRPRMELELNWKYYNISFTAENLIKFAKYFFELGLKSQKGE